MNVRSLCLVVAMVAAVGWGWAAQRPDLSGKWVLNLAKSKLATPGIASGTVRIIHREPRFHFARVFQSGDGPDFTSYELTTDGVEKLSQTGGMATSSRLYWEGEELVLEEKIQVGGRTATNVVRYTLGDAGATLSARESFRGPKLQYDNLWVFDRR